MTLRPIEWDVLHPLDGQPLAIIRLVWIEGEPFYRAVSANPDREQRKLIGYWGDLDTAHHACLALWEQATGRAISGGNQKPGMTVPAQKPPPKP